MPSPCQSSIHRAFHFYVTCFPNPTFPFPSKPVLFSILFLGILFSFTSSKSFLFKSFSLDLWHVIKSSSSQKSSESQPPPSHRLPTPGILCLHGCPVEPHLVREWEETGLFRSPAVSSSPGHETAHLCNSSHTLQPSAESH